MADSVIAASLKLDGSQANQSVKSFKTELREAQAELLNVQEKFGTTSQEAAKAATKVAEMRDRMGDANKLVDAFNPDAKFRGFGNVVQAVAGGFSALTGSMALFGVQGEAVEKTLLKVQAAMAISQGVNSVLEGADSFKSFAAQIKNTSGVQKVFTASSIVAATVTKGLGFSVNATSMGFKVLRGAIIATGVGALVVGIGMLIANFDTVKKVVMNLVPGLSTVANVIGKIVDTVTDFVGITSEAGRQLAATIKGLEKSIEANERFLDLNADKYDQYTLRKFNADLEYQKKKADLLKDEKLTEEQRNSLVGQAEQQRSRLIAKASSERAAAEKKALDEAGKVRADKAKQQSEKDKQNQEQQEARQKQAEDQLRTLQQENFLAAIADERERSNEKVRIDFENAERQIQQLEISEGVKTEMLKEQQRKRDLAIISVKAEFDTKDKEEQKRKVEEAEKTIELTYQHQLELIKEHELKIQNALKEDVLDGSVTPEEAAQKELEITRTALQAEYDLKALFGFSTLELEGQLLDAKVLAQKEASDAAIAFDKAELESKLALLSQIGSGFGALAGILGQHTKAAKAAALAEIAIGTGIGFIQALDIAQKSARGTGPAAAFAFPIFYASQIAAVLGAASRAKSILKSDSVSAPLVPSVSANVPAPLQPARAEGTSTSLPQNEINRAGDFATRAYVVESEMTSSQERNRRLNRQARLGG